MRRLVRATLLGLLAVAGACPDSCSDSNQSGFYTAASGRWHLGTDRLHFDPCEHPGATGTQAGEALLAGTRWCPAFACIAEANCQADIDLDILGECYDVSVDGPGESVDGCLDILGGGELVWRFEPRPCDQDGIYLPEQVHLFAAEPGEIHGRLVSYLDDLARNYLTPETGQFPADASPPGDADEVKVLADQPVHLRIDLRAHGRRVTWPFEGGSLEVTPLAGPAPRIELDEGETTVHVRAPAGSQAALTLHVDDVAVSLGRVVAVAPDQLASLEPIVAYGTNPDDGGRMPLGARAVVRDAAGDLVYGAPATWEVLAGSFPLSPVFFYTEGANLDYVLLVDSDAEDDQKPWCFVNPSSGTRSYTARLAARVGDLREEVELAWTVNIVPGDDFLLKAVARTRPNPRCQGPGFDDPDACACRGAGRHGQSLLIVGVMLLASARRRRRAPGRVATPITGASPGILS